MCVHNYYVKKKKSIFYNVIKYNYIPSIKFNFVNQNFNIRKLYTILYCFGME